MASLFRLKHTILGDDLGWAGKAFQPDPMINRCVAQEGEGFMVHLVTAVGIEHFLGGNDVSEVAGQKLPTGFCLDSRGVFFQLLRCILFRIDGDRAHPYILCFTARFTLHLGKSCAEHRAYRSAGCEDEIQHHRHSATDYLRQWHLLIVHVYQSKLRDFIVVYRTGVVSLFHHVFVMRTRIFFLRGTGLLR